ncbi:MAG: hypothetical protein ACRCXZ_00385, partial [Patescibacteria group bacterium]
MEKATDKVNRQDSNTKKSSKIAKLKGVIEHVASLVKIKEKKEKKEKLTPKEILRNQLSALICNKFEFFDSHKMNSMIDKVLQNQFKTITFEESFGLPLVLGILEANNVSIQNLDDPELLLPEEVDLSNSFVSIAQHYAALSTRTYLECIKEYPKELTSTLEMAQKFVTNKEIIQIFKSLNSQEKLVFLESVMTHLRDKAKKYESVNFGDQVFTIYSGSYYNL